MPASGMPVASTITSMPGCAISASASAVTWVARFFSASPSEAAANCSAGQPAVASWLRARSTLRSATATTCRPRVSRACARNMVPNLPAPIRPTVTGRFCGLAFEQESVEVHAAIYRINTPLVSRAQRSA